MTGLTPVLGSHRKSKPLSWREYCMFLIEQQVSADGVERFYAHDLRLLSQVNRPTLATPRSRYLVH